MDEGSESYRRCCLPEAAPPRALCFFFFLSFFLSLPLSLSSAKERGKKIKMTFFFFFQFLSPFAPYCLSLPLPRKKRKKNASLDSFPILTRKRNETLCFSITMNTSSIPRSHRGIGRCVEGGASLQSISISARCSPVTTTRRSSVVVVAAASTTTATNSSFSSRRGEEFSLDGASKCARGS